MKQLVPYTRSYKYYLNICLNIYNPSTIASNINTIVTSMQFAHCSLEMQTVKIFHVKNFIFLGKQRERGFNLGITQFFTLSLSLSLCWCGAVRQTILRNIAVMKLEKRSRQC